MFEQARENDQNAADAIGKVAMITGAASGIGAASARLFSAEGCRVVLADIQDGRGAALADAIADARQPCALLVADCGRE